MSVRFDVFVMMLLVATGSAMANDDENRGMMPGFSDLDTNDDLYIDKDEFREFMENRRKEMGERFGGARQPPFKGRGDHFATFYDEADSDGDSLLNEYEYETLKERMADMRENWRNKWGN
jgi:hypothetical protein